MILLSKNTPRSSSSLSSVSMLPTAGRTSPMLLLSPAGAVADGVSDAVRISIIVQVIAIGCANFMQDPSSVCQAP
jgi:hypothetical protein